MIRGIVELAHLKNTLVHILLDTKEMSDMEKASLLSDLVVRAQTIHSNLQIVSIHNFHLISMLDGSFIAASKASRIRILGCMANPAP
jgi:hypothetical protein